MNCGFRIADWRQTRAGRPIVRNEPNSSSRPGGGIPSIPLFYHSTIPARCRLCKTNPICGGARWDEGKRAKQSQFFDCGLWIQDSLAAGRPLRAARPGAGCTNEPNSWNYADREIGVPGSANYAKRTRFSPPAEEVGRGRPTYQEPIVQNEPKSSIADCGSCHCERSAAIWIADCAKRSQFGGRGWTRQGCRCCCHRGQVCQTNPIWATAGRRVSGL